jgi:DNA-binding GntR family transcriptional regulator
MSKPFSTQQVEICTQLREDILLGRIMQGEKITEKFISERMGVKRGPARECLLILEGEGLIRKVPSLGYFTESFSQEDVLDVYELRLALETMACRRAAVRASREHLVGLTLLCEEEQDDVARDDFEARWRRDLEFHQTLVRASESRLLERAYAAITLPILGTHRMNHHQASRVAEEHGAIVQAIREKNGDQAAARLKTHLSYMIELIQHRAVDLVSSVKPQ